MSNQEHRTTVAFDHHTPEWVGDPYSVYRELRDGCPLAYSQAHGGFWILSRYGDVREALTDWQTFSSAHPGRVAIPPTRRAVMIPTIPIEVDPPRHTQYRAEVIRFFLRSEVGRLEPRITEVAQGLLDGLAGRGGCDLVAEYATPLLGHTLAAFLDLPPADLARLEAWNEAIFAGRLRDPEGAVRAQEELTAYIGEQMERRRQSPGPDLFSRLVSLEVDGRPLSEPELQGYGRNILTAGREATIDGLCNSLWYLAQNPAARQRLSAEPELMGWAVEEFLRLFSPVQLLGRVATRDVELHGQTIRKGESVAVVYGSANRDPRAFPQAEECVLERKPNPHLAFGVGPHACMGANLARLNLRVGIREFLRRVPQFRLSEAQPPRLKSNGDARGFTRLPVEFERVLPRV